MIRWKESDHGPLVKMNYVKQTPKNRGERTAIAGLHNHLDGSNIAEFLGIKSFM
jgi:hypothetical protein